MWLSFSSQLLFCLRGRSGEDSFLVIRAPGRAPRVNQVTLRITDNQFLLQQLLLSFSFSSLSTLLLLLLVILLLLLLLLLLLHYYSYHWVLLSSDRFLSCKLRQVFLQSIASITK